MPKPKIGKHIQGDIISLASTLLAHHCSPHMHIPYPNGHFTTPTTPPMSNLGTNPSSCAQTPLSGYLTRITNPMYMFVAPALCDHDICINVTMCVCSPWVDKLVCACAHAFPMSWQCCYPKWLANRIITEIYVYLHKLLCTATSEVSCTGKDRMMKRRKDAHKCTLCACEYIETRQYISNRWCG